MSGVNDMYDQVMVEQLRNVRSHDFTTDTATTAIKNLKTLSECRPPTPEPEPEVTPEPTTFWDKLKAGSAKVWDNETTRVTIKAVGAFGGVALVTWTTVYRDHVITKEAQTQANQRNS